MTKDLLMHRSLNVMVTWLGLALGCAGADGSSPEIETRNATSDECTTGGTVLTIDGELGAVVCNGIDGSDGSNGTDGLDGPVGAQGPTGSDAAPSIGRIEGTLFCAAAIDTTGFNFDYSARVFTDGSTWSAGGISDSVSEFSASAFYDPSQAGASTAAVFIGRDSAGTANGGFWKIEVDRSALVVTITYTDPDFAEPDVFTLSGTANGCVLDGVQQ